MVVAAAIRLKVHHERVRVDRVLQDTVEHAGAPGIRIHDIVGVGIMGTDGSQLFDADAAVVANDIVHQERIINRHAARRISVADNDTTAIDATTIKDKVIRDGNRVGCVPQLDSPRGYPVHDVIDNVPAQIGMVDPLNGVTRAWRHRPNIVHDVADHVVIRGAVVLVINACAAVARATAIGVMYDVTDDTHIGSLITDSDPRTTTNIEAHNIDKVSAI